MVYFTIPEIRRLQDSATIIFAEELPRIAAGKIMKKDLGIGTAKRRGGIRGLTDASEAAP